MAAKKKRGKKGKLATRVSSPGTNLSRAIASVGGSMAGQEKKVPKLPKNPEKIKKHDVYVPKEAGQRGRHLKKLITRGLLSQATLYLSYTGVDGRKAIAPSLARHHWEAAKAYGELERANARYGWNSNAFRRVAMRWADRMGVQLREIYTFFLSP